MAKNWGQYYLEDAVAPDDSDDGSIMIVVATDAPLGDRNLERLAKRAIAGLARTGAILTNGSGDYVIAFSTADGVRRKAEATTYDFVELANSAMSPCSRLLRRLPKKRSITRYYRPKIPWVTGARSRHCPSMR